MEPKKTKRANVERRSGMYFCLGLMIAISMTITAFEWKFYENELIVFDGSLPIEDEPVLPPVTEILPPKPPPPVVNPVVIEVPDDSKVETLEKVIFIEPDDPYEPIIEFLPPTEENTVEPWVYVAEENASFKGGQKAFLKYLKKNLKYPNKARNIRVEGKVYVEFIVGTDGVLKEFKVLKGIGSGCDEEALRVLKTCPAWNPAKQRAKPVNQKMVIPIVFRLN